MTLFLLGMCFGAVLVASFGGLVLLDYAVRLDEKRLRRMKL